MFNVDVFDDDDDDDDDDGRYARASTPRTASQQMVHALVPPAGWGSFAKSLAGRGGEILVMKEMSFVMGTLLRPSL